MSSHSSSITQNGVSISDFTSVPDGNVTPTTTLSMSAEHIDAVPHNPLPPAAAAAASTNRSSNPNIFWTSTLAPAATVTQSATLPLQHVTTTTTARSSTTTADSGIVKSSSELVEQSSSVRFAPPPIIRSESSTITATSLSRQSSLSIDTEAKSGPTITATSTSETRAMDEKKEEPAAPKSALAAALPPISSPHDVAMLVWRVSDMYVMYWRPLLFPLVAWLFGRFGFSIFFAILLTFVWYYAVKNGHLLPRPPPSTQQIKAEADRLAAVAMSPTTSSPLSTPSPAGAMTFQVDDPHPSQGYGATGLLSLPFMLSGLTVKYPDWVFYPDVERTKWINDLLERLWPHAKAAARVEIDKFIKPYLDQAKGYVVIAALDFGTDAPFVGGIKVYDTKSEDQVMMDVDVRLALEPTIRIEARYKQFAFPVSVTAVSAAMTMRVTLSGLVGKFPCFRRLGVSLAQSPTIWTTVDVLGISLFDVPIIGSWAQHLVEDIALKMFGWPRELSIPIMVETAEEVAARNALEPKGILHVYLMSATNLRNADVGISALGVGGKSDPYCVLSIGEQSQKSAIVDNNCSPNWNSDFEFIVYQPLKEVLSIKVFDSDVVKVPNPLNNKRLGDIDFPIASLLDNPFQDVTLPLQHTTKGNIRFQCEWRPFASKQRHKHRSKGGEAGENTASNSVLFISSLRAYDLPIDNCYLRCTVGSTTKKTEIEHVRGREIEWEERFSFPVFNADVEQVTLELKYDANLSKLTGFATKSVTLGMREMKTKSSLLATVEIDVREVARTGQLSNDFVVPLPPTMKSAGRPKLHVSLMLRELAASATVKERKLNASRAAIPGTLLVHLISATNLLGVDHGRTSDPYVELSVGTQKYKSHTRKKTCDPRWDERHTFKVADLMRDDLQLDCRDWGGMMEGLVHKVTRHNNHLGDCHIPLRMLYEELHGGGEVEKEIPLNHTVKGLIKVGLQFTPDAGVQMPPPSAVSQFSMPDLLRLGSMASSRNVLGRSGSILSDSSNPSPDPLSAIADDAMDGHVTATGLQTDATAVAPMLQAPISQASVGIATGMRTAAQLQHEAHEDLSGYGSADYTSGAVSAAPSGLASAVTSAPSSQPTSGTSTPAMRPSLINTSDLSYSSQHDTSSLSPSAILPTHSRQMSASTLSSSGLERDEIHHDPKTLEGYLIVRVHHSLHLPAQHKDGTISAYVKLQLGKSKVHTAVVTADQPVWEADLRVPIHAADVAHMGATMLKLKVKRYKKGVRLFGNEVVGEADVALSQLLDEAGSGYIHDIKLIRREFTLMDPKTNHVLPYSIVLSCKYEPVQQ